MEQARKIERFVDTPTLRYRLQLFPDRPVQEVQLVDNHLAELFFVGGFLMLLQGFDGVLTAIGVELFGVGMEGNVLIRSLMISIGSVQAITVAKVLAILAIVLLISFGRRVRWTKNAMVACSFIYLGLAIIPWFYTISSTFI